MYSKKELAEQDEPAEQEELSEEKETLDQVEPAQKEEITENALCVLVAIRATQPTCTVKAVKYWLAANDFVMARSSFHKAVRTLLAKGFIKKSGRKRAFHPQDTGRDAVENYLRGRFNLIRAADLSEEYSEFLNSGYESEIGALKSLLKQEKIKYEMLKLTIDKSNISSNDQNQKSSRLISELNSKCIIVEDRLKKLEGDLNKSKADYETLNDDYEKLKIDRDKLKAAADRPLILRFFSGLWEFLFGKKRA